jgi:hypothetical protein
LPSTRIEWFGELTTDHLLTMEVPLRRQGLVFSSLSHGCRIAALSHDDVIDGCEMEPSTRIELATTSLPWRCSTTELRRHSWNKRAGLPAEAWRAKVGGVY